MKHVKKVSKFEKKAAITIGALPLSLLSPLPSLLAVPLSPRSSPHTAAAMTETVRLC